jgi:hypothetical protein
MIKAELQKIEMYAKKLNQMIHPEDELEGWVQSKLAVVSAYMGDVKHYLDYELQTMEEGGITLYNEEGEDEEIKLYQVGFTYEDEEGNQQMSIVYVHSEDAEDAIEIAEDKYEDYYDSFEVVSCDLVAEGGEQYGGGGNIEELDNELLRIKLINFLTKVKKRFPYKTYFLEDELNLFVIIFSDELTQNQADALIGMVGESPEFFDEQESQLVFRENTGSSELFIKLNYNIY